MYDGKGRGNCVAACIASIFELPLSDVDLPDGCGSNELMEWSHGRWPWLECRVVDYGQNYREVEPPSDENPEGRWEYDLPTEQPPAPTIGYWIASVVSPRGVLQSGPYRGSPILHAVVMRGGVVAWDPHPGRDEAPLGPTVMATWWIARNPARAAA